ncbi:MAG: histone deacetylase family protein [Deinococcus-Thermus bacterium]|jgi:acetoin utilization deacetylase AcuC-like enzyme|nr:histone deacetylase family protein [Deinococcota bacterium]
MSVFVYSHDVGTRHDPGPGHPEAPIRLKRILAALDAAEGMKLERRVAEKAERADLARVHTPGHVAGILDQVPTDGRMPIDMDTWLSPSSGEAALRAAGAAVQAVDAVLNGETRRAFVAMRPPGHHAEPAVAMGFCFFNNIAVAAARALEVHGLERVAVLDFDVHHGNGTQAIFETVPKVMYASIHQAPLFPGTGREDERGLGNLVNTCVAAGTDGPRWRRALEDRILPAIDGFAPQLVFISAGFDAHAADPLANVMIDEDDFAWATERMVELAERHAQGRVVSALEGGYDPDALVRSVMAHLKALEDRA